MVTREELRAIADATGLTAPVVEKDYVLGWLLWGIYEQPRMRDACIFKGGTCLKKCFFETYRFSEDLDFTLTDAAQLEEPFLIDALRSASRAIYDQAGIELPADRLRFERYDNPRGNPSVQGRVYFRSQFVAGNNMPAIKLDLTTDELLVDEPARRAVVHSYTDEPDGGITALCYSFEEVFAEKLRALGERTRARDLYDVVNLYRNTSLAPSQARVREILAAKCQFKKIATITLDAVHAARDTVVGTWEGMLKHQLPMLPPFEAFWSELPSVFQWLEGAAARPVLGSAPVREATTVLRPRFGGLSGLVSNSSVMERIRFAGQNHLLVELEYTKLDGSRRSPTVEAYSLRQSKAGDILLGTYDVDDDQPKSYRVDRIINAHVLSRTFVPRYEIELSPQAVALPVGRRGGRGRW